MSNIINKNITVDLDKMKTHHLRDFLEDNYGVATDIDYSRKLVAVVIYDHNNVLATFEAKKTPDEDYPEEDSFNWSEIEPDVKKWYIETIKENDRIERRNQNE